MPPRRIRLELGRLAKADLANIRHYGVEQYGFERAIADIDDIERAFRQLLDFPESGVKHKNEWHIVRSLSFHNHRNYYYITDDAVVIQRVLRTSTDAERWLG